MLPKRVLTELRKRYHEHVGLTFSEMTLRGAVSGSTSSVRNLPVVMRSRAHALQESVRWGEAYVFFAAPVMMSWVVPVFANNTLLGGLVGPDMFTGDHEAERSGTVQYLVEGGGARRSVERYVRGLPVLDMSICGEAAHFLLESLYDLLGAWPVSLASNRDASRQQREIAESLQERKQRGATGDLHEERILLSLIRVGDRAGARRVLNGRLAAMFLRSPKLPVLKARVVEMFGYLVRTAVEDSPLQERLLERHMPWLERILETSDFERLCTVVRDCLDDFLACVYRQGFNTTSVTVQRVLDYIGEHYAESISLSSVSDALGMSKYHVAHIVKEATGKTVLQHVKRLRIDDACRRLCEGDEACADMAYDLGFTDQSYFTRQFREMTGTTPARYRRGNRG